MLSGKRTRLERLTASAPVATVLGSIPASVGTVESEGRQMSSAEYSAKKKSPQKILLKELFESTLSYACLIPMSSAGV